MWTFGEHGWVFVQKPSADSLMTIVYYKRLRAIVEGVGEYCRYITNDEEKQFGITTLRQRFINDLYDMLTGHEIRLLPEEYILNN